MADCVFCKIINNKLPSYTVYQDTNFMAFLDVEPLALGHTLLVPKKHVRWVYQVSQFTDYWQVAKKLTPVIQEATGADFISYLTVGLDVPHAHIHLIPRFFKNPPKHIDTRLTQKVSPQKMKQISQKINDLINL